MLSATGQGWHAPTQASHLDVPSAAHGRARASGDSSATSARVCASCCGSALTLAAALACAKPGGTAGAAQKRGPNSPGPSTRRSSRMSWYWSG